MPYTEKCIAWYMALTEEQQTEVRGIVGLIPDWVRESLAAAGIPVVDVEMDHGGSDPALMPTALMIYLADQSD